MTVLKETAKALFIEENGTNVWVPKAWIKKDGSLNERAIEKLQDAEWKEETSNWTLQKSINFGDFSVVRETEKALLLNFNDSDKDFEIWVPKSMKDNFNFVDRKMNEHNRSLILR